LIDRLERLLAESTRMPLSAYLIINEDDVLDVIDQMRTAIPQQIKDGERLERERERIIAQSEEEAERVVQLAHEEANKLVADHDLSVAAELRADTIMERAQREADVLRSDANEYARVVLGSLDGQLDAVEEQIANLLITVRNGLETLSQGGEVRSEDSAFIQEG
jgi:vacuolar-type H+-ATPase subunit H